MPIYEYRCDNCGRTFEVRQSITEHGQSKPPCPKCQSADRVEQRLSSFNAVTSRKS